MSILFFKLIKFFNTSKGTKICWGYKQQTTATCTQTFPVAFKSTPYIVTSLYDSDGGSWYALVITAHSATSFTTKMSQYAYEPWVYYIAVSR